MLDMGEKIKILREKEKWTQKELAAKIGMKSSSGISQYEENLRLPSLEVLKKLCYVFNVSADYFLDISNNDRLSKLTNGLTASQIDAMTTIADEFHRTNLKASD